MSLTNRLSLFFLTALALALAGFSLSLYLLTRSHLQAGLEYRLTTALETLIAAIEVHADDVEWEPLERRITLGEDGGLEQVRWTLCDQDGQLMDCSRNLERAEAIDGPWRLVLRRISAGRFEAEAVPGYESPSPGRLDELFPSGQLPQTIQLPADRTGLRRSMVIAVAASEQPVDSALNWLGLSLTGMSLAIWSAAAVAGRWLCRQGLKPITHMARSARNIRDRPGEGTLLEVAATGDEVEELGQSFNELLTALRDTLERQKRFTGDASHQLRTPLTALLGQVEVALRHQRDVEEYRRVLELVQRRGTELTQIVEALLLLARSESALAAGELQRIELSGWLEGRLMRWSAHPRFVDLSGPGQVDSLWMETRPILLAQVVDNLIDNACKYSSPGSPINLEVCQEKDEVVLKVIDQGPGVDQEEIARLCEPFYRSREARWQGTQGIGLGLAVAKRLVQILGGRLVVTSVPGQGSEFSVRLLAKLGEP